MQDKKIIRYLTIAVLTFTLIYLISITGFIFQPIITYITAIAVPIVGSGVLFYITNPAVNFLERKKVNRIIAIILVFLLMIVIGFFSVYFVIPVVQEQSIKLSENVPNMIDSFEEFLVLFQNRQDYLPESVENTLQNMINNIDTYVESLTSFLFNFLGQLFNFIFAFFLIPFFLFFMLKDGKKFIPFVTQFLSKRRAESFTKLMREVNHTLSSFIQGQFIVSFSVGLMLLAGYFAVGLNYALIFALFGLIMNLIPFVGPWISAIPAVIIGFFQDPMIGLWTALIMIVAQQIESNIISPNVMGKVLNVHPLTVITLILAGGAIAGFLGILFVIPAFAVFKTVLKHFYQGWLKNHPEFNKGIF